MISLQEKSLYQQIHPLRLVVDWASGLSACYLFWIQDITSGIVVAFGPSLIVSLFVIKFGDLEKVKKSPFGKYFQRTYTKTIDMIRFGGFMVLSIASWYHEWIGMAAGLAIIIATWTYGIVYHPAKK
jgi:hypothetical protein